MKVLLSPAKSLNVEEKATTTTFTLPTLLNESEKIMKLLKKKSPKKLQDLQGISEDLAQLNYERNQVWHPEFNLENAKQALFMFTGDVYVGFDAKTLSVKALDFAQNHVGILSGLYGILKPLDLIQPYRLEMGTKLKNSRGENLYQFWGDRITQQLNAELETQSDETVVNLASNEYFKAIKKSKLKAKVIDIDFLDYKNGKFKVISFFAKKARGAMARFICEHQITDHTQLKAFDTDGYVFSEEATTNQKFTFLRKQ